MLLRLFLPGIIAVLLMAGCHPGQPPQPYAQPGAMPTTPEFSSGPQRREALTEGAGCGVCNHVDGEVILLWASAP